MGDEGVLDGLYKVEILEDRVNVVSEQEWVKRSEMIHQTVVYWGNLNRNNQECYSSCQ